jgi:peptide/nickel transport system permease protein
VGGFAAWIYADAPMFGAVAAVFGLTTWLAAVFIRDAPWSAGVDLNLDTALMRLVDVGLSFPFLLLVMAVGAALDTTSATTILGTLGLTSWLGTARIVRAKTLQVRTADFVVAARALGQSTPKILAHHVLPNVAGPLVVLATISVAQMIVAESVLSYLGAGIGPPTATWGRMLQEGQEYYLAAPWTLVAPAIAILMAVFGFNMLGEGLRDALDPREDG